MADKAALIEFLASTRVHPTSGLVWNGGLIGFFVPGTTTGKAVWLDRDKTLPTIAGQETGTLGVDGSFAAYGDGVYDVKIYDASDTSLTTPLKTYSSVNIADATLNATLTDPDFLDGTDATKIASWAMSTISSGTTRTFTLPDEDGVMVTSTGGVVTKDLVGDVTGDLTGNVTGDVSGDAGSVDGASYETASKAADGDFTSGTISYARIGKLVVISFTNMGHASLAAAATSVGFIPATYRPTASVQSTYASAGATGNDRDVTIQTTGQLSLAYDAAQTASLAGSISYVQ